MAFDSVHESIHCMVALGPTPIAHVEHSVIAGVSSPAVSAMQIMNPAIASTNTILALITASDGVCDKAPVLEFRLKAGSENDITATHRVRAYVFNQTVSEGAPLFKHSSMCGRRSHLCTGKRCRSDKWTNKRFLREQMCV